jgi:hypothetical protein
MLSSSLGEKKEKVCRYVSIGVQSVHFNIFCFKHNETKQDLFSMILYVHAKDKENCLTLFLMFQLP